MAITAQPVQTARLKAGNIWPGPGGVVPGTQRMKQLGPTQLFEPGGSVRGWTEPALVLVAVALLIYFLARPAVPPQLDPTRARYQPGGPPLTFNGVKPGDSVRDIEARLGPPDFRNPTLRFQQWQKPLTQIHCDKKGVILQVRGSGTGVLCQGKRELIRCGEAEEAVARAFGEGKSVDNHYRIPLTPYRETGSWVIFADIFCNTQSGQQRCVDLLQLTVPEQQPEQP